MCSEKLPLFYIFRELTPTYDPNWMNYWNEEGYADIDIGVRKTIEADYAPLIFSSQQYLNSPDDRETDAAIHALWEAKNEGGCHHIYSHQLFQNTEGKGAMGFVSGVLSEAEFYQITNNLSPTLSSLIHISHARLSKGMMRSSDCPQLSGRQKDVLMSIASGLQYKEIAHKLEMSENTVAFHMAALRQKLGCKTSREILGKAYQLNLLSRIF